MRLLVWIVLGALSWLFWRSVFGSLLGGRRPGSGTRVGRGPGRRGRPGGGEIRGEELVRDRICQTYLPRSRALREVDPDGTEHFFCSETCRARHAAGDR